MATPEKRPKRRRCQSEGSGEEFRARSIRLPKAIWDGLDEDADRNKRSANLHLWWLLEQHLKKLKDEGGPP